MYAQDQIDKQEEEETPPDLGTIQPSPTRPEPHRGGEQTQQERQEAGGQATQTQVVSLSGEQTQRSQERQEAREQEEGSQAHAFSLPGTFPTQTQTPPHSTPAPASFPNFIAVCGLVNKSCRGVHSPWKIWQSSFLRHRYSFAETCGQRQSSEQASCLPPARAYIALSARRAHGKNGDGAGTDDPAFCFPEVFRVSQRSRCYETQSHCEADPRKAILPEKFASYGDDNRHAIRAATFQVYGFGAENHLVDYDTIYQSRDTRKSPKLSTKAFQVAAMLTREPKGLAEQVSPSLVADMWKSFSCGTTMGPTGEVSARGICYGSQWMGEQDEILQKFWLQLHRLLVSQSSQLNRFQVMLCLCTMVYSASASLQPVQCLAAFFAMPDTFQVALPSAATYSITLGYAPTRAMIQSVAEAYLVDFFNSPEYNLPQFEDETDEDYLERRRDQFEDEQSRAFESFVTGLHVQWIRKAPVLETAGRMYLECSAAFNTLRTSWGHWHNNHCLREYLTDIATTLRSCSVMPARSLPEQAVRASPANAQQRAVINNRAMFALSSPSMPSLSRNELDLCQSSSAPVSMTNRLAGLLERVRNSASSEHSCQTQYVDELQKSLEALKQVEPLKKLRLQGTELGDVLSDHLRNCQENVNNIYTALHASITEGLQRGLYGKPSDAATDGWKVAAAFMAPRTSSSILVGHFVSRHWGSLSQEWQDALLMFGIALTKLQQAERLLQAKTTSDLLKELSNSGYSNSGAIMHPQNLLLEIESSILIRRLNMGEGKSSVIVPIVAAHLADGTRLVRVVVGKPQAKELLRTLVAKLGGLLNRRIFYMPFNRSLRLKEYQVKSLHQLYRDCMEQGGVLLLQPEHILSFKLMAIEYQSLADQNQAAEALVDLYHFLDSNSRDIVDESDENFSPKFELIYTMGEQRPIELSPERWTVLQRLLDIVVSVAPSVQQDMPEGIEITHRSRGRFPRTRILRTEAGALLLRRVTEQICATGFPGLPIGRQSQKVRAAIFEYLLEYDVSAESIALVEFQTGFFTDTTKGPLLLLRGLIAGRVLLFALRQKRWRVNYGLDPNRTPSTKLAVPYRAKDCPSTRAEFSHPDVVILLTCLSYYYEGLTNHDLCVTFTHLMKSDQAEIEYDDWVKGAPNLPTSFHRLAGVNIKDLKQITENAFPHLRHSKNVIDYFLSHLVFSKELKEFSHKLSASGWDLGAQKNHATTGFSGTNDSRHVLPLDVRQLDIQEQLHTNALVLENLLRPENKVQLLHSSDEKNHSSTKQLLEFVAATENQVHVILDVGAQVLELTNIQVAKRWLELVPPDQKQEAVVFFDDDDEICVIDRKGAVERLQTSPYCEQLDRCLVFLDQAHTRGTDLRLPEDYRAAVTLGPDLTKDRLAQACMRMRKLGHGQSVIFCVSKEMQSRICMTTGKAQDSNIEVDDVLMWAISETHTDLRRLMPLWAIQGSRFEKQQAIWDSARTENGLQLTSTHTESFLEEEAQTIAYRYRPTTTTTDTEELFSSFAHLTLAEGESSPLHSIQKRCEEFGVSQFRSAALQEEQEKELAPEIEQERQIERPHAATPAAHALHPDLVSFITTGSMPSNSITVKPAFLSLSNTIMADCIDLSQFPSDLLVSNDYAVTVTAARRDSYQRPVQWILTGRGLFGGTKAVIISPFEAQELMPRLAKSTRAHLHIYAPRMSLAAQPLDQLRLYSIPAITEPDWALPRNLRLQLNLFAGQLYFGSYQDYADTCDMLSLAWRPSSAADGDETSSAVASDGFVASGKTKFTKSPVQSIKMLLTTLRRDCQEIDKTHWGRILAGEFLTEVDFES
ncbi:hypothetical protein CCM_07113 [Cordyceps militaris CM01]|uniref:ubiquitinyl hydrolase 1 n=1 Tax=Cordyceps militaris (strain CM01) TaxID=983644 RepID=G3JLW9_CORMM|nr:uncharacterized protein CCM_07113 [Cordyceps militaris CM01]EGX90693.1 hypothetical protein CCM_07113 [Cordyceps militaris CM01]